MLGWTKGDKVEETDKYESAFNDILDKLDEMTTTLETLNSRLMRIENTLSKHNAPAEKLELELEGARTQIRYNTDFMQNLVLQLICSGLEVKAKDDAKPKISPTLEAYLAKKAANGSDYKPKLP